MGFTPAGLEFGGADIQPLHAVEQCSTRQTKLGRGAGLIALILAQAIDQQVALHTLHALAQAQLTFIRRSARQIEVFGQQQVAIAKQQRAGDQALEFTNVAREIMTGQLFQRGV